VNRPKTSPTAFHRSSYVRAAIFRISAFSFEKAILIGLRSGLYLGRNGNRAPTLSRISAALALRWAAQVVEDDDVPAPQRRCQYPLDVEIERPHVHRSVGDAGRMAPVVAQGHDERLRVPVSGRGVVDQAPADRGPARGLDHVGLVDEDRAFDVVAHEGSAECRPEAALLRHIGTLPLTGPEVFFLCDRRRR